jgi:hypothetical protein
VISATDSGRNRRGKEIHQRTPGAEHNMTIMEPICSQLLLHKEEGWQTAMSARLLTTQQMDQEKLEHITHPISY